MYTQIVLVVLLWSIPYTKGFEHAIGPLAFCDGQAKPSREYVETCYQRCNRPNAPDGHGTLELYAESKEGGGPQVVHCTKIKISQTFTETWTFSQIKSTPIIEHIPVTLEECKNKIKELCPTKNCNIRAPHQLTEEYHYASDTTLTKDYISLVTLPSGIDLLESVMKITPLGSSKSFPLSDQEGEDRGSIYVWDYSEITVCPFESVMKVGCDVYGGMVDSLVCRSSRIVVDNFTSGARDLMSPCSNLKLTQGGLIYSWVGGATDKPRENKKLMLTSVASETQELAAVRQQANDALSVIDEDLCQIQCEVLEMVTRINLGKEIITRLGNRYILTTKEGQIRECKPLGSCKLTKPHVYCGGPVRLGVSCDGATWLWDPLKSYLEEQTGCHRVMGHEKLQITLGNKVYDVGENLTINADDSFPVGISHDILSLRGSKMIRGTIDVRDLRESWQRGEHRSLAEISPSGSEAHYVDHWDVFGEGWEFGGEIWRRIRDIAYKSYILVAAILTAVALAWGYSKIREANGKRAPRGEPSEMRQLKPRSDSPQWI